MSEYSIQFWVMVGTLITAGATLLLGGGVLLAWLQLKHQRSAALNERRITAVLDLLAIRQLMLMEGSAGGMEPGQPQAAMVASERVRSAFRFAGREFRKATLNFDRFFLESLHSLYSQIDNSRPYSENDPLDEAKTVLAHAVMDVHDLLEEALDRKVNFDDLARRMETVTDEATNKFKGSL